MGVVCTENLHSFMLSKKLHVIRRDWNLSSLHVLNTITWSAHTEMIPLKKHTTAARQPLQLVWSQRCVYFISPARWFGAFLRDVLQQRSLRGQVQSYLYRREHHHITFRNCNSLRAISTFTCGGKKRLVTSGIVCNQ